MVTRAPQEHRVGPSQALAGGELDAPAKAQPDEAALAKFRDLRERQPQTQRAIRAVLATGDAGEGFLSGELARLNGELKAIDEAIQEAEAQPTHAEPIELDRVGQALQRIDPLWDVLFPAEQERMVRLLVEDITVTTTGIDLRFRTNGIEQIVNEVQPREAVQA